MRSIDSKTLVVVLSLIGGAAIVPASNAQTETNLLLLTNAWRYFDGGTAPAGAWTNFTYSYDASWKQGLAVIGDETTALPAPMQTYVPSPGDAGPYTIYCRTNFYYPLSIGTNGVNLIFSNLLDDGAVFYLNGKEIQRVGVAAGIAVNYNTWANRTVGDATVYDVFTIAASGSPIRIGNNVLAVEVHNINATSSDTVFATSLTARQPVRIVITDQPDDVTTSVGTPVSFSVEVTGSDPVYRWYKRPNPVILAGTPTYKINNPTLNSAGTYYVTVSNILGRVTSADATLTVVPDKFPPGPVSAVAQTLAPSNTIYVVFTESLLTRTATNPASYRLELAGTTNTVVVSNAAPSQNTVTLTVGGPDWHWGSNYILTVTGVADQRGNYLNGLSNRVAVAFVKQVFPMNGPSKHWDWSKVDYPYTYNTNMVLGDFFDTWMLPESSDTNRYWPTVLGVAWNDRNVPYTMCGTRGTDTGDVGEGAGYPRAYYFRTPFVLPPNNGQGSIRIIGSIDDGVAYYINGVELPWRYNLPAGKLAVDTSALRDVDPIDCVYSPFFDLTNLVSGTNLLASEVHNTSDANTLDMYYGVQIEALIAPRLSPALQIKLQTNTVPRSVLVTWSPTNFLGWVLKSRPDGTSTTWTRVATNSPFQTNVTSGPMREYRLMPGP